MITITLTSIEHRGASQIAIGFAYDIAVKKVVKAFEGVKWSQTHKTFYVGDTSESRQKLFQHLREANYYVDYSALRKSKYKKRSGVDRRQNPHKEAMYKQLPQPLKALCTRYADYLRGKRLSSSTVATYGFFVLRFLDFAKDLPIESWNNTTIELYLEQVLAKEGYSISSHRQCIGALKHFTELCGIDAFDASEFKRPKKDKLLPTVLSKEEVIRLLQAVKNLKHRAAIALIYSSGLRISELLNLELKDLDPERQLIYIKKGKGRKDRTVVMSTVIRPLLSNYLQTYCPERYFIEGKTGERYTASSVRAFLKKGCREAGIKKTVTPHTLRHSYATHMLEQGVGLRYIQQLLGHAKPETTMIYTHVASKDLHQIASPLDGVVQSLTDSSKEEQKVLLSRGFSL